MMRRFFFFSACVLLCLPSPGRAQFHFAPPVAVPTRDQPFYMVTGDFNRDGHLDLAVCNRTSNDVSVFPGDGKGGFPSRSDFPLGDERRPAGMAAADMNGDGALDLITANHEVNTLSILYGDGRGGFSEAVEFPAGGPTPEAVVVADFNRDGHPDLAAANRAGHTRHTGDVTILEQDAAGRFAVRTDSLAGYAPRSLLAADLNGDGAPDLVSANFLAPSVYVFTGRGDGTFDEPVILETALGPVHIVGANLNDDNRLDLVIANRRAGVGQHGISVYLGAPGGQFRDPVYLNGGELPAAVAAADFDDDEHCDIALANGFTDDLMLYRGDGRGGFADPTVISFERAVTPRSIIAADLDHDGDYDLVIANKDNNTLTVLLNEIAQPTGIAVAAVSAVALPSGVVEISWEITAPGASASVYRQAGSVHEATAPRRRITKTPITGIGPHRFFDRDVRTGRTYTYWVEAIDADGSRRQVGPLIVAVAPPDRFELAQNAPNPFNAATTITYRLARPCHVTLRVHNLLGEHVIALVDRDQAPGVYSIRWDGRNDRGAPAGSGIYLYTLRAGAFTATRRMTLLK